jgi:hypothetical protein
VSCFQQQFVANISPTGTVTGIPTFSWTGINDPNAIYGVQVNDSNGNWLWANYHVSGSSIGYNGSALTSGMTYGYAVSLVSSSTCSDQGSFIPGTFTYLASGGDTSSPTVPTGVSATATSPTQINLSWTASTDNVGVTGYKVYRNGVLVGSPAGTGYSDTGLAASTGYSYTVSACDAAGNCSARSTTVSAITQAAPITPSSLSFTTPATLQSSGRVQLSATASYSNSTSKVVTPTWTSSNPAAATVSSTGVLSAGSVSVDTPLTLTASYTENGVTVGASQTVTISAAPATLAAILMSGSSSVQSGGQVLFKVTAAYSDGSSRQVTASGWTLSNAALGSVNSRGVLAAGSVTADIPLTVTASYSEGGVNRSASASVTISAIPAVLSGLTLIGAQGTVSAGKTLNLVADGRYSDGSRKPVIAAWQVSNPTAASISASGVLTAATVTQDTQVLITSRYSEGGVSVSAEYLTLIQATVTVTPTFQAEVEAAGTRSAYSLSLWFNTAAISAPAQAGTFAGTQTYNLYVAAWVPAGSLLSVPTLFLLNRSKQWQALSFPLAEYLSAVAQNEWQLIELVANLDVSPLSGTLIYVGYGTSDKEMLDAGRYKIVYQVP